MSNKTRNPASFIPGNPGHDGSNAGRKPDWLKAQCSKIIKDKKLIQFLGNVASGEKITKTDIFDLSGKKVGHSESSATPKDRIKAIELLLDRGFGKPVQPVGDKDDGLADLGKILRDRYGV